MKKSVTIIVEKASDGFTAYVPELPGCITFGNSLDEIKENIREAITLQLEGMKEDGEEIPFNLQEDFNIELKLDVAQVFNLYQSINSTGFAKRIGMNQSLLSQYVNGIKKPSEKQARRILEGVVNFGRELSHIQV
ncbi:MAG: XRE family transcriptional regulator [Ignavibacteria bacterium CG08_land_8_20_14_0_20_37_9]|nr:MAG: XRE family transcriptional regulator [Ignavibacteria bacterium CG08_land_8_20_14_0_20_37_9]